MTKFFQICFVQCLFIGLVQASPIIKYSVEVSSMDNGDEQKKDVATAVLDGKSLILLKGKREIYKTELLDNELGETECNYQMVSALLEFYDWRCEKPHSATIKRKQILAMARALVNVKNKSAHELLDLCQSYDGCRTAEKSAYSGLDLYDSSYKQNGIAFEIRNKYDGKVSLIVVDTHTSQKSMKIEFNFKGIEEL